MAACIATLSVINRYISPLILTFELLICSCKKGFLQQYRPRPDAEKPNETNGKKTINK